MVPQHTLTVEKGSRLPDPGKDLSQCRNVPYSGLPEAEHFSFEAGGVVQCKWKIKPDTQALLKWAEYKK